MAVQEKREPYNFDPAFERAVLFLCCSCPQFWGKVGHALDPESMGLPESKLVLQAVRAIAKELGKGPSRPLLVIQRLRRWMGEGKVTADQIQAVAALIDDAEEGEPPEHEALANELVPILRRRMERKALDAALTQYQHRGDMRVALEQFQRAQRLGESDSNVGTILGDGSFEEMERLKKIQRLPTGILELDDALNGGAYRGTLSVFMSDTGGGKSMGLIQVAVTSAMHGFDTAVATLELPEPIILARLKANMTGLPIDAILADPDACGARERLKQIQSRGNFGRIVVKSFTPEATTVEDLIAWVKQLKEELGIEIVTLVVDYADKLTAKTRDDSSYNVGKLTYQGLRIWAERANTWCWTACAAKRKDGGARTGKGKKLDGDDAADSLHKIRVSDLWITLNVKDEEQMILYFIAKNRLGRGRISVGPLPYDFECARIAPIVSAEEGNDVEF